MAERPGSTSTTTDGTITDEGIARLRARIGTAEPHPLPPHYSLPTTDTFRHVAEAYGDGNPLWCDPDYAAGTRWAGPLAPPPLVGGDTLVGEDEITSLDDDTRALLKGDPLRGVHAFYSASAREWWAPLRPLQRVARRNALVAVLDKPSDFAGRAVHEWTGQVFRQVDGPLLAAQYRLMVRTERTRARERKKYDDVELARYDDDAIAAIEAQYAAERPRGAEARWWEDVAVGDEVGPLVKGPLTVTDMICWHVGMGMGLYGVRPLGLAAANRRRIPRFFRRDDRGVPDVQQRVHWDPEFAAAGRQPHHLRLRPHARDLAHPPVHRLDGRRRLAVEARLRVPPVQLRGRHPVAPGHGDPPLPGRGRATGRRPRRRLHQPAGRGHHARARHRAAAVPGARPGPPARPAGRRPAGRPRRDRRPLGGAMSPMSDHLRVERGEDAVLRLHLDKPAKRNALDEDMVAALIEQVDGAGRDEAVRSILVTAEGDHFCSGFDIVGRNAANPGEGPRPRVGSIQRRLPSEAHRLIAVLCTTQVPVVVGARGWVAGIGLHLVAAADFVVLADDARVWEPFSQRGFTPDSGGTWLLPRLVGLQRARELLVLGTAIDGATAVAWGLGHRALPAAEVDAAAEALAVRLAAGPTVSLGLTKWLLHTSAEHTLDQHLRDEAFAMELSSRSEDFREGLAAFVDKRDPGFTGR